MSIEYYVGVDDPCVNAKSKKDLYEIIDLLHTQVMDNMGGDDECLDILSDTMRQLDPLGDILD